MNVIARGVAFSRIIEILNALPPEDQEAVLKGVHALYMATETIRIVPVPAKLDEDVVKKPGTVEIVLPRGPYGRNAPPWMPRKPDVEFRVDPVVERCRGDCSRGGDGPSCNLRGCQG